MPAFALAAGEACALALMRVSPLWPLAAFLLAAAVLFGYGYALRGWQLAVFFLAGLLAMLLCLEARRRFLTETVPSGVPFEASFTVEGEPRLAGEDGARWTSFASSVSGVDVRVLFQPAPGDAPPEVGDVWRCAGWLEGGRGGAGDFRRRAFWVRGRGTFARRERAADAAGWRARLAAVRRDLSRRVGIGLDAARPEIAGLNRAILLGERAHLPRATRRVFVDAGTMHVFAVSGLHVMIVAGVLRFLLVLAFVPVRLTGLALVPLLWGYVLVIGSPPSALRAAAMASVYFLAPLFWRRSDGIVAWSLTFIVFHILFPGNLLRVGSLLSFAVMLGILLFLRWAEPFASRTLDFIGVTFAAWAAGVPIAAVTFGTVTPGGILANLVLMPAAGVSVGAGALGALTSYVSPAVAAHLNNAAALMTQAMVGLSWAVGRLPGANFRTEPWSAWGCAAWYATVVLSLWLLRSVFLRRRAAL